MYYYSEKDIRNIVEQVVSGEGKKACENEKQKEIPVEISARHVHLTNEAVEALFGEGYQLTKRKDLSQPGEFATNERVKIVTEKGALSGVAVLGPVRKAVQVELSLTDFRSLGISAPVNLSGDLTGGADILLIGPNGHYLAKSAGIAAKAHIHMTTQDAKRLGVSNGDHVRVRLKSPRSITINECIIRADDKFALAMHIDFDEANAGAVNGSTKAVILPSGEKYERIN